MKSRCGRGPKRTGEFRRNGTKTRSDEQVVLVFPPLLPSQLHLPDEVAMHTLCEWCC